MRALEICLLSGKRASEQQRGWTAASSLWDAQRAACESDLRGASRSEAATGVFVFRDREDLYKRINRRVEEMFDAGAIEEVRAAGARSETASKMIGLREIGDLLEGKMSLLQCVAAIQQATRRYAKRQLTWFRRQTNFEPLNLSLLTPNEARISLLAKMSGVLQGND